MNKQNDELFAEAELELARVYVLHQGDISNPKIRLFTISNRKPSMILFLDNGEIIDTTPHEDAFSIRDRRAFLPYEKINTSGYSFGFWFKDKKDTYINDNIMSANPSYQDIIIGKHEAAYYSLYSTLTHNSQKFDANLRRTILQHFALVNINDLHPQTRMSVRRLIDFQNKINELLKKHELTPTK